MYARKQRLQLCVLCDIAHLLLQLTQLHFQTGGSGAGPPTKVGEAACYCGEANDQGIDVASGGRPPGQYL